MSVSTARQVAALIRSLLSFVLMVLYVVMSVILVGSAVSTPGPGADHAPNVLPGVAATLGWILLMGLCILNGRPLVRRQANLNLRVAKGLLAASAALAALTVLALVVALRVAADWVGDAVLAVVLAVVVLLIAWPSRRSIRT